MTSTATDGLQKATTQAQQFKQKLTSNPQETIDKVNHILTNDPTLKKLHDKDFIKQLQEKLQEKLAAFQKDPSSIKEDLATMKDAFMNSEGYKKALELEGA